MANLRLDKIKPLVGLAAFLFIWWAVPISVKSYLKVGFTEFQSPAWVAISYLDDLEGFGHEEVIQKLNL